MSAPARGLPRRALICLGFGLAGAALMAYRIAAHAEAWLDRTYWLLAMAGAASALAALITCQSRAIVPRRASWRHRVRTGFVFACAFMVLAGLFYCAQAIVAENFETIDPDHLLRSVAGSLIFTFVQFLIASPSYFLPWFLPILCLLAAFILPLAARAEEAVEPPQKGV